MSQRSPTIVQPSLIRLIPQLAFLLAIVLVGNRMHQRHAALWGLLILLVYVLAAREILVRHHRQGIRLVRRGRFDAAIPLFEESLAHLDRSPWIDRLRSVILLSASAASYREMALVNIGFCHVQAGRRDEARRAYQRCLERFPDSGLARAALQVMGPEGATP